MVRAWYYDNSNLDQRCPHLSDPPEFIDLDTLKDTTGVLYFKVGCCPAIKSGADPGFGQGEPSF